MTPHKIALITTATIGITIAGILFTFHNPETLEIIGKNLINGLNNNQ